MNCASFGGVQSRWTTPLPQDTHPTRCTASLTFCTGNYTYAGVSAPHEVRNHVRRHRRQVDDMTQQDLADRVGVTRQTILSIERGKYNPSVGLALRLAGTFGVAVEALFEIEGEEHHG